MQLTWGRGARPFVRWLLMAALACGSAAARAESEQAPLPTPAPLVPPAPPASSAPGAGEAPPATSSLNVRVGSDVAAYADSDHVYVLTPGVTGHVENPTAGWSVDGSYLVDVVSAASVDVIATASKNYTEVRQAGTLGAAYQPGSFGGAVNGSISREPDYLSWSAGGSLTQDLLEKNLTLFLGFNHGHDVAGRNSTPFSVFSRTLDTEGFKLGATLVLDRTTIASLVLDGVFENGDPSKPYRFVPLFSPGTSVPVGASIALVNSLRVSARPLEQLPLSRQRYAASVRLAHRLGTRATVRFDERLYDDSWALKASSTDARLLVDLGTRFEVGPHARLHLQSATSFWQRAYTVGPGFSYPALRTGDRELGPLFGVTGGLSLRWKLGPEAHRTAWVLGLDANVTETRYLDDIYITNRASVVTGLSLEAEL